MTVQLKDQFEKVTDFRILQEDYEPLSEQAQKLCDEGVQFLALLKLFREANVQFKQNFIFKNKDYVQYVKVEICKTKKLLSVLRVYTREQMERELKREEE